MWPVRDITSEAFERWLEGFRAADSDEEQWRAAQRRLLPRILTASLLLVFSMGLAAWSSVGIAESLAESGFPAPRIDGIAVEPSNVTPGGTFTLEIRVVNDSSFDSPDGGITVSFPQLGAADDDRRIEVLDMPEGFNLHLKPRGQRLIARTGGAMSAEHLMVEVQGPWPAGETRRLRLQVAVPDVDRFLMDVRSAMADLSWRYRNAPTESGQADQQGWNTERLAVAVGTPRAAAEEFERMPVSLELPANGFDGNYVVHTWSTRDGLPQSSARAIVHGSDGYLWVATQGGLSRFDGMRFHNFRVASEPDLGSNRILSMLEDSSGRLWIGTEDAGVVRRVDGHFERLPVCGQSCMVFEIVEGAGGSIWIHTTAGVFRLDRDSGWVEEQRFTPGEFAQGGPMIWHSRKGLLVASRDRIFHWSGSERAPQIVQTPDGSIINALAAYGEQVLIATTSTVFVWENGRIEALEGPEGEPLPAVTGVLHDPAGNLWFGLTSGGLLRRDASASYLRIRRADDLRIERIMADREGNIWLGTRLDGLARLRRGTINAFAELTELLDHPVMPIIGDGRGGIWIGRVCQGLIHVRSQHGMWLVSEIELGANACVWSLHRDQDGSLLVGSNQGPVRRLRDGRVSELSLADGRPAEIPARMFYRDSQGRTWLGTDIGLFRVEGETIRPVIDSPREIFLSAHEHFNGEILFGTGNGLLRFDGRIFRRVETGSMLDRLAVRAIHEDLEGVLWMGTYGGGLWRREGDRITQYTPGEGLYDDVVSCIIEDRSGRLWMSGNRGIFKARRSELNEYANGEAERVFSQGFNRQDGMLSEETNGGGQPSCHQDLAGNLWFPTLRGPVRVDPYEAESRISSPPLVIESVRLDGEIMAVVDGGLNLPGGARNLEINYTALNLSAPERLQFRYRLTGYEDSWTNAGPRRTAYYPVVPAGNFRFEVQVGSDYGEWFPVRNGLELSMSRRLVEQPMFYLGLGVLVLMAIVLFTRWRMQELELRDQALKREVELRTRELQENNRALARLAQVDELTGIANYRRFRLYLNEQWERCRGQRMWLSIIVIDVDKFKPYNDALGHQAGDECLRSLAQSLDVLVQARGGLLARYGGEEFLAVLPGQELDEAADIAEQLRQAVVALGIARPDPERGVLTASFGVSSVLPGDTSDPDHVIAAADRALYRAKEKGRNRVEVEETEDHDHPRPNPNWAQDRKRGA